MHESTEQLIERATEEVDVSLLEWFLSLSILERLRVTSRNAAALERLRRAASTDR